MTWDEFKLFIDKELEKHNKDGSIEIRWIDVNYPSETNIGASISKNRITKKELIEIFDL